MRYISETRQARRWRASECDQLAGRIASEVTTSPLRLQEILLSNRFGLSEPTARAVAELAFGRRV